MNKTLVSLYCRFAYYKNLLLVVQIIFTNIINKNHLCRALSAPVYTFISNTNGFPYLAGSPLLLKCKNMKYEDIPLINNEARHNFELTIDGARSFVDYKQRGNKVYLIHTEVPEELEGKGVAAALVEKTFIYLEQHDLKIIPLCTYVLTFLKRHPEWNRLRAYPIDA